MKTLKTYFLLFLFVSILSISNGCATLPNVSEKMENAETAQKSSQIVSSDGLLSRQKSDAIMERLKRSVAPTDILDRHTAVVESISESPLTKGNKVILLEDGLATYAAMFKAMQSAKDHINLESYIIEDDETGRKFADLLLQKQAKGIQVNIIYDSMGSMNTDAAVRGVDVKIILPGTTDSQLALHAQRYHYSELLKSGVKIYEHSTSLLHAKTAVIDRTWSTVGSTNMDFLSMLNNDEVNAIILNQEFAVEMEKMFAGDLANSRQIQSGDWEKRPLLPRSREWFFHLFIRWL